MGQRDIQRCPDEHIPAISCSTFCHFEEAANAAIGGKKVRYELLQNRPPQPIREAIKIPDGVSHAFNPNFGERYLQPFSHQRLAAQTKTRTRAHLLRPRQTSPAAEFVL